MSPEAPFRIIARAAGSPAACGQPAVGDGRTGTGGSLRAPTEACTVTAITPDTASQEGPDTVGFRSSGPSPTAVRTVHLIGPGQVGRRFLRLLAAQPDLRLVAVSDSTGTAYRREGLEPEAVIAHKAAGRPLREWPRAEAIATELAISVVQADVVVDATTSDAGGTAAAVARTRAALRHGAFVALAGKNALAAAAPEWLGSPLRRQIGCNATLGGAGLRLCRELDELRGRCDELLLCGNVTTTVIVQAIERGASVAEGIEHARQLGILETDPELDLGGSDAAVKLLAVWGAVFGEPFLQAPGLDRIPRQHVRELDPALLQQRFARGATTRLLASGGREPGSLRVAFVELPRSSPLAAPPDRVVYGYRLGGDLRVHTGFGVGYEGTAAALLDDVRGAEVRR